MNAPFFLRALLVAAWVLGAGCAHVATLRPTPRGETEVDLSLGGPMLKLGGAPIPAPLSAVGVRYGVNDRADIQGHFHPTAAVLGVLGLDVGSSLWLVKGQSWLPDVTATGRLFAFTDFKAFRPYIQLGAVASWRLFDHLAPYFGGDGLIQFGAPPLFSLEAGLQLIFGRFTAQLEARWFGLGHDTQYMVVDWVSPGGSGAIGMVLGFGYRFGGPEPTPSRARNEPPPMVSTQNPEPAPGAPSVPMPDAPPAPAPKPADGGTP